MRCHQCTDLERALSFIIKGQGYGRVQNVAFICNISVNLSLLVYILKKPLKGDKNIDSSVFSVWEGMGVWNSVAGQWMGDGRSWPRLFMKTF